MAGLHWLASSEQERQKALELAKALLQKDSRDELGIGTIRDGLGDLLFPGTSTLHTRARYFFFIPWAFQAAAAQNSTRTFSARLHDQEADLIAALKQAPDSAGLIGARSGADLERMPSTLYWQGLLTWGIRQAGTPEVISALMTRGRLGARRDDDGELLDADTGSAWHPNLPRVPRPFPAQATFELTCREADFLLERLRTEPGTRDSALAQLAQLPEGAAEVHMVWDHPLLAKLGKGTQHIVEQARRVSLLMQGAALIYNVELAVRSERWELESEHRKRFESWVAHTAEHRGCLIGWDLNDLWDVVGDRVPWSTRQFVIRWQTLVRGGELADLVDEPAVRSLIVERERAMKGRSARTANEKALAQWGGASAIHALDFRWSVARGLIGDIRDGLEAVDAED